MSRQVIRVRLAYLTTLTLVAFQEARICCREVTSFLFDFHLNRILNIRGLDNPRTRGLRWKGLFRFSAKVEMRLPRELC
jgi:hypothetical protein